MNIWKDNRGFIQRYRLEATGDTVAGKESNMLWTIFVILLVLWLLAVFSGHVLGGLIHVLLVIAIVVMLVRVIKGRKPV
jgi:hypothetical protein